MKRDFFKRHDIQIIESMPNGKDYVLFYLKLLAESVDHDGSLRFSDTIPYSEQMLSTITNTNVDIVKSALEVFTGLHLIEILEDQTIFMDEVNKMLGGETYWAEKKRKQRTLSNECPPLVQCVQVMSKQEKEIELDKEIDIDKDTTLVFSNENTCHQQIGDVQSEKKKKRKSPIFDHESKPYKLAAKLSEMIHTNNPDAKQHNETVLQSWAYEFDKAMRLDKRTARSIYDVMFFSQNDVFWKSNILSAKKLREHYDRLKLLMEERK